MTNRAMVMLVGLLASLQCLAQEQQDDAAQESQAQEKQEYRLSQFYEGDSIVRLKGSAPEATLSIPLSEIKQIQEATLHLKIVSSIALVEHRSVLNVRFNNATISQVKFNPQTPQINATVTIPTELWRAGFNTLTFAPTQHYTSQCEDSSAPELWSELDLYNSSLSVVMERGVEQLSLSQLSGFFSPGIGGQETVTLISKRDASQDIKEYALPLVAQALALRNQYKPLQVIHTILPERSVFPAAVREHEELQSLYRQSAWYLPNTTSAQVHVLVGTKDSLADVLTEATVQQVQGAFLGFEKTPSVDSLSEEIVAHGYRLIVSGTTPEEVILAARTLAVMDDELNPGTSLNIQEQRFSSEQPPLSARTLRPGGKYTLAEVGVAGARFRGESSVTKRISLLLPADFYVPESASVKLFLDFGYGAAFGPGSMMNITINNELVHGLPLDNPYGQSYRDYQLTVPARHLKGGVNNIDIEVDMRAPVTGQPCDDISGSHLVFQLHDSSTISLPEAGSVVTQPNLALFAETAYPLASVNKNVHGKIYIGQPEMLSGALTLAGKLAQVTGTIIPQLSIQSASVRDQTANAFLLTTPQQLEGEVAETYGSSLSATKQWPYRLQNELHNRVHNALKNDSHKPLKVRGVTQQDSELGALAVLVASKNPAAKDAGTLFILAAETSEIVNQRINDLVSLTLWGQMAGDFFAWETSSRPAIVMQVADGFEVGDPADRWLELRMWLSNNPWYWLVAIALVVVLCSVIAYVLLKRRNKRIQEQW